MTYKFNIAADNDIVAGDIIRFSRSKFSGTWRKPKYEGEEIVEAEVMRESYGTKTGQHTFTLKRLDNGQVFRITGRNLYAGRPMRTQWPDEAERERIAELKHMRGDAAKMARRVEAEFRRY
jgi:hypothetical protein